MGLTFCLTICYVGITSQSMSSRLRIGFIDNGHYGYHGYKWKDRLEQAELLIWTFPDLKKECVEAIEAEMVYYIRNRTGNWPKYQMEIHFHEASESECQIANLILDQCLLPAPSPKTWHSTEKERYSRRQGKLITSRYRIDTYP